MLLKSNLAIQIDRDQSPYLMVVVDTEEEFNWNAPVDRNATSVEAMQFINLVQDIFDEYHLKPCYAIDYPVASQATGYQPLVEIYQDKRCEIGAHLHPWVSPPMSEELKPENTYPGNLEQSLEYEKLNTLTQKIKQNFNFDPSIYKAGRYGFGVNTAQILKDLGYSIDLSYSPSFDHRADGGPDYSYAHSEPFWIDEGKELLEIPITSAFVGRVGSYSRTLFNFAQSQKKFKLPGILSKLGMVDRLVLSPEGYTSQEHIKITEYLLQQGVKTFTWSFHSPAVMPGANPYVQSEKDLNNFLDSFRRFFDYFFIKKQGVATTPTKLKRQLETM